MSLPGFIQSLFESGEAHVPLIADAKELGDESGPKLVPASEREEALAVLTHPKRVADLAFSPDGKHLVTGSFDKMVRLWKTDPVQHQAKVSTRSGRIGHIAFPKLEHHIAFSELESVSVWDLKKGKEVRVFGDPDVFDSVVRGQRRVLPR